MVDRNELDDVEMDTLFAAAKSAAGMPSAVLMARIVADAEAHISAQAAPSAGRRAGWLALLLAAIGGWPAVAGLATATVTGIWVGFSSPVAVDGYIFGDTAFQIGDLMPSLDAFGDLGSEG